MRAPGIIIVFAAAALTSLTALGCKSLATGASEEFSKTYSCPESSIAVKPREDLKWSAVLAAARTKATPPAEVAKDPARLAVWQKDQDAKTSSTSLDDTVDVFQVTGCSHDVLMGCWRAGQRRGSSSSSSVSCIEGPTKP